MNYSSHNMANFRAPLMGIKLKKKFNGRRKINLQNRGWDEKKSKWPEAYCRSRTTEKMNDDDDEFSSLF